MQSLGILGVGELSEKVVHGLRRSGFTGPILLSPRNRQRAEALARDWDCRIMPDNQALVDAVELVLLGVRPDAVAQVAAEVDCRPDQHLVSLAAGISLGQLQAAFPASRCVRLMLTYAAQFNGSTVVVSPADETVQNLFAPLGTLVSLDDESAFELATVASCMNGWFYFLLNDLQQWLSDKGLSQADARALVLGNMQDCLSSARYQPGQSLKALGQAIATPGTFTAAGLEVLMHQPAGASWGAACEVVLDALLTRSQMSSKP